MVRRLAALAVVVLCALSLALVAASLSAPREAPGTGEQPGIGGSGTAPTLPGGSNATAETVSFQPPRFARAALFAFLAVSLVVLLANRGNVLVGATLLLFALLAELAGTDPIVGGNRTVVNESLLSQGGGGEGRSAPADRSGSTTPFPIPGGVLSVVAVAVVAAAVALRSASGSVDETTDRGGPTAGDSGGSGDPVGEAAGRAAAAVADADDADLSNAVYEAWHEMTTALDVSNPETATPGEFAAAARDGGLDPSAVDDLTAVFRAVRYGDEPAADYERRALDALERIQADAGDGRSTESGRSTGPTRRSSNTGATSPFRGRRSTTTSRPPPAATPGRD